MGILVVFYFILQLPWLILAADSDCNEICGTDAIPFPFRIKTGCGNLDFVSRNIQTDPVLGSCLQRRDNSMKQTVGGRSTAGNIGQDFIIIGLQAPPSDNMFTLLAPAGRQVQEIQLATSLDQVQPK
ncbi:hypothetical protein V6N13_050484 [Hibiscus sabdariffa]